jgi:hypothetical protein
MLRRAYTPPPKLRDREPPAVVQRSERAGVYAKSVAAAPIVKTAPKRNRALLDMAQDRPCLLLFPWVPAHPTDTVVACHSNKAAHGKAGARKADDQYSVWGCVACHWWLDQGSTSQEVKDERFMSAHLRQVNHWRRIVTDKSEPERFRKAAQWALDALNATPVGAQE